MAQPLSWGPATFAHRFIVPWACGLLAAACVYTMALAPALSLPGSVNLAPLLRIIICLSSCALAWGAFSLAASLVSVEMDNHNLFVSNSRQQATIPLAAVTYVWEANWSPHHSVMIGFDRDTPFGRQVTFLPDMTDQWFPFAKHPVVEQLEGAVRIAHEAK